MTPTYTGKEHLFRRVKSIYSASLALVYFSSAVYFTTGCSVDAVAFSNAYFGEHSSPGTNLTNLYCYGNESGLIDCTHSTTTSCRVLNVAGVRCQGRTVAGIKLHSAICIYGVLIYSMVSSLWRSGDLVYKCQHCTIILVMFNTLNTSRPTMQ